MSLMKTTRTQEERSVPTTADEIEIDRLTARDFASAFGGAISYHPSGGKCVRARCPKDAPYAQIGRRKVKLPCADHAAEEKLALEAEERLANVAVCMTDSGRTRRMADWSFESYRRDCGDADGLAALAVAERWVKTYIDTKTGSNVLLWGPVGCGKTGLAWSMVRALCERGLRAKIVNFGHLLSEMKDCYSRKVPTVQALEAGRVPVLVLDDLGSERPTEWACGELLGIVDCRYERGLPTIYVTNYAPGVLAKRLGRDDEVIGQRILSRMQEGAVKFEFRGGDRRLAA